MEGEGTLLGDLCHEHLSPTHQKCKSSAVSHAPCLTPLKEERDRMGTILDADLRKGFLVYTQLCNSIHQPADLAKVSVFYCMSDSLTANKTQ